MAPLPFLESPLNGYVTEFNQQQHLNFLSGGSEVHIIELYYEPYGVWRSNDLTQLAGAPPVSLGARSGLINGYVTSFNNQQHINFLGNVGSEIHVFELYYSPYGAWHWNDLTQLAGAPTANNLGSAPHGYVTYYNNQQHVNFVGNDLHVHELFYDGAWHWNDLTKLTGAPNAGEILSSVDNPGWASALDGYETSFNNQQHVNFIGTDKHVHELYYADFAWRHNDLSQLSGGPNAFNQSSLVGYATYDPNQQHIIFFEDGIFSHVNELYYDNAWHHNDLMNLSGAPGVGLSPLDGYPTPFNNQQHVNFVGSVNNNFHVMELYYDGAWHHNDLTQLAGAPPVGGNGLCGYTTSFNNQQHVDFVGNDLHVYELLFDGVWHQHDLTAIAK